MHAVDDPSSNVCTASAPVQPGGPEGAYGAPRRQLGRGHSGASGMDVLLLPPPTPSSGAGTSATVLVAGDDHANDLTTVTASSAAAVVKGATAQYPPNFASIGVGTFPRALLALARTAQGAIWAIGNTGPVDSGKPNENQQRFLPIVRITNLQQPWATPTGSAVAQVFADLVRSYSSELTGPGGASTFQLERWNIVNSVRGVEPRDLLYSNRMLYAALPGIGVVAVRAVPAALEGAMSPIDFTAAQNQTTSAGQNQSTPTT